VPAESPPAPGSQEATETGQGECADLVERPS
jgi:hypothetical protein